MKNLIKRICQISHLSKEGHIGSSLSILDILYVLYEKFITFDTLDRNRVILSKGHASLGLYAIMEHFGLLENNSLETFGQFNSVLGGHPSNAFKNIEASTGSLGHGLPISIGIALAYKIKNYQKQIFVIVGDGEMNE